MPTMLNVRIPRRFFFKTLLNMAYMSSQICIQAHFNNLPYVSIKLYHLLYSIPLLLMFLMLCTRIEQAMTRKIIFYFGTQDLGIHLVLLYIKFSNFVIYVWMKIKAL